MNRFKIGLIGMAMIVGTVLLDTRHSDTAQITVADALSPVTALLDDHAGSEAQ